MMPLPDFEVVYPESLKSASQFLSKNSNSKLLAGGTDIFVVLRQGSISPNYLVSLEKIPELAYIDFEDKFLRIGPTTTLREIERNKEIQEEYKALFEAVRQVGSVQVRSMATLAGNICNASPAADTATPLLVFDAQVSVLGPNGERTILLSDFFKGPKKNELKSGEIVTEVQIPRADKNLKSAFIKISRVSQDLSKVNAAAALKLDSRKVCSEARLALGAVAPVPLRINKCEALVTGKSLSGGLIEEVIEALSGQISPITDLRSTSEYRNEISKVALKRVLSQIMEE